jgi:hypothetical protein
MTSLATSCIAYISQSTSFVCINVLQRSSLPLAHIIFKSLTNQGSLIAARVIGSLNDYIAVFCGALHIYSALRGGARASKSLHTG